MKAPTQQQLNDPEWWDENAPDGATHCLPKRGFGAEGVTWFKRYDRTNWKVWSRYLEGTFLRWCESAGTSDGPQFIHRPTKPQAPEWDGEGFPPVGVECELNLYGYWVVATVLAYGKTKFLYEISPGQIDADGDPIGGELEGFIKRAQFRPLRTKEQRERDQLTLIVKEAVRLGLNEQGISNMVCAAGFRRTEK